MAFAQVAAEQLEQQRQELCRLVPERALVTLEEAEDFLHERGMLTLMPDCSLPSLFGACHEEPYKAGGHGFASWPKTKWWWGGALGARPGVYFLRLHAGKGLFLTAATAALADVLCRAELARADEGGFGEAAKRLVRHLAEAGPTTIEELKEELGLAAKELRPLRTRLERVGALVATDLRVEAKGGGHRHTSELHRWDHIFSQPHRGPSGLDELVVAGVRAAVIAPEREVPSWFSWRITPAEIDALVAADRLSRPAPGSLSAAETASAQAPGRRSQSPRPA